MSPPVPRISDDTPPALTGEPAITAVIFDIDGTLVDSNDAHAKAWVDAFAEAGRQVPFDRVRPLIGMGGDKLIPTVSDIDPDSSEGHRLSARRSEIFRDRYLPAVRALAGAGALARELLARGVTLAIATSAKSHEVDALLALTGAADVFDHKASSDDADRSKPDPDIVAAALERLGRPPREVLMLGDTPYDLEAARRAGVAFVAFRSGGWSDGDFEGALAVFEGPGDLLAHVDRLPLAPRVEPRSSRGER
jgi:HAD superfamily hydrolase (TIGR01509 family)